MKIAPLVLVKLFLNGIIYGNARPLTPSWSALNKIFSERNISSDMDGPENKKNYTIMKYWTTFYGCQTNT